MIKSHDKKAPKANPHNAPAPKPSPNEQEPVRGKNAPDSEVKRHARESMERNHRLGKLLAQ